MPHIRVFKMYFKSIFPHLSDMFENNDKEILESNIIRDVFLAIRISSKDNE